MTIAALYRWYGTQMSHYLRPMRCTRSRNGLAHLILLKNATRNSLFHHTNKPERVSDIRIVQIQMAGQPTVRMKPATPTQRWRRRVAIRSSLQQQAKEANHNTTDTVKRVIRHRETGRSFAPVFRTLPVTEWMACRIYLSHQSQEKA